jgi:hypothetical protein
MLVGGHPTALELREAEAEPAGMRRCRYAMRSWLPNPVAGVEQRPRSPKTGRRTSSSW